jgi:cytidylate kinase
MNSAKCYIIDYRLAYKFIKNCFHVYLQVSEDVAIERLVKAQRIEEFDKCSHTEIKKLVKDRNCSMNQRFQELYKTNFMDPLNYNLVINTDSISMDSIMDKIFKNYYQQNL